LKVNDENSRIRIQDPDPDPNPLARGMDRRIRIHPKMSWIRNTASTGNYFSFDARGVLFVKDRYWIVPGNNGDELSLLQTQLVFILCCVGKEDEALLFHWKKKPYL
jgi:hypothetical protein